MSRCIHTVDVFVLAGDVVPDAAAATRVAVAAVPPAADALSELPHRLRSGESDDVADDLVPGDTGVFNGIDGFGHLLVAV